MFTGIVTDIGTIIDKIERGDTTFRILTSLHALEFTIGTSISHSGICLTVVEKGDDWYEVSTSAETLSKTTAQYWQIGTRINLERSLRLGDEIAGHIIYGHVDGVTELLSIVKEGGSHRLRIKTPQKFIGLIAQKGSIALNGVSLTINDVEEDSFGINIIPHTWQETTFGELEPGDMINFEIDTLARYVHRLIEVRDSGKIF